MTFFKSLTLKFQTFHSIGFLFAGTPYPRIPLQKSPGCLEVVLLKIYKVPENNSSYSNI